MDTSVKSTRFEDVSDLNAFIKVLEIYIGTNHDVSKEFYMALCADSLDWLKSFQENCVEKRSILETLK